MFSIVHYAARPSLTTYALHRYHHRITLCHTEAMLIQAGIILPAIGHEFVNVRQRMDRYAD